MHAQSGLTLCHLKVYSLPGSSVHGNFQARILEWVAISSSSKTTECIDKTDYILGSEYKAIMLRKKSVIGKPKYPYYY